MSKSPSIGLKLVDELTDLAGQVDAISKSQAIASFDLDGMIISANQNFLDIFGYTLAEIEGRHHSIFVEPGYAVSAAYRLFWSMLHNGHFQAAEYQRIGKDGREVWLQASYNPIIGFDGRPLKVMNFATDVTERKRMESVLAGQLNAIAKSQAVIEFAPDGTILNANQNFLTVLGYELEELQGKHHHMLIDPDDRESPEYLRFWESLGKGEYQAAEYKRIRKDGGEIWFQATYNPVFGLDGNPCKVIKLATDVTVQKLHAAELAGQAKAIARSQAVIEFDMDGNVLTANENYLAILGYELDEIRGRHHSFFLKPGYCDTAVQGKFWDALRRGAYQAGEFRRIGKDGREIWLQAAYNPVLDSKNSPRKVVKFATDITARKRAEKQVASLEAKFRALRDTPDDAKLRLFESIVVHAKDAILITEAEPEDLPGPRIVYANQAFTDMTGYDAEEVVGKTPRMFQGPLTGADARAKIKAALNAWQSLQIEIFNYHKNGEGFWLELSISPLCDENGRYTHWISVQRDITARKREQERLRKSENFLARTASLAGIGGWEVELATGELFWSAETYRIHGLEPGAALTVENAISFYAPEARDIMIAAVTACSQDGVPFDIEIPLIHANGERIWTRAIGSAEFADGKPFRISGLFQDIDKQVKERLALQQANDKLNLAKEAGGIGIWTWDIATNEIVCDSTIHRLYGVQETDSASLFETWLTCLHEQDRDRVAQAMQDAASGKADYNTQFRIIQPGGALRHIRSSGVVSRDPAGTAIHMTGALWDVTKEETENLALKQADARTKLAADSGGIGIWEWDILNDTVDWDGRTRRLFDVDPAVATITYDIWKYSLHPEDRDATEQELARAVAGTSRFDTCFRTVWRDGSIHHIRGVSEVTRDAAGTALRMLGVNWDVTRETAENLALKVATERMQLAADGGEIGILEYDVATNLLTVDAWVYRIYGTQPGPDVWISPELWDQRVHPDDRLDRKLARDNAIAGIRPYNIEYRIIRDDGAVRHVHGAAIVTRDQDGRALRMTGTVQDVTERKELEAALAQRADALEHLNERLNLAAHRLTLATDSGGIGVWDWDIERDEMSWDDWMCRLYDVLPESLGNTYETWSSRLHPEDRAAAEQAVAGAVAGTSEFDTNFRVIWRDGSVRHIMGSGIVTRDDAGKARRMIGVNWDVTAQFAQNLALQEATTRMRLAADSGEIGILEFDLPKNRLFLDEWSCRILGIAHTPGQGVPAHIFNLLVHPDDRARRDEARQNAVEGISPFALDYRIIRADGMTRYLKCSATITRDVSGQAIRMTGSMQDITSRKEIEEKLAETAQKLAIKADEADEAAKKLAVKAVKLTETANELKRSNEELSQFAAIASHDLQEPLRMVASYTQLLGKRYKGRLDADADEFIAFAVDGTQRMKRLIQDLLAYSRVGTSGVDLRSSSSQEALTSALWNLRGAIEDSGALVTHDALPAVLADASQLTQLFQNLVGNAIKYRGPEIPLIHISVAASSAGRLRFLVRDNGLGIDAEHFDRIFGMFQRLHGAGEYSGTGIGLAICKKIVDRHGGVIGVDSKAGEGSSFHFTLAEAGG